MVEKDDYPDHQYWASNDANFPFPIPDELQVHPSSDPESVAMVSATVFVPTAIPFEKTIAERSAGIAHSWRFTVAIVAHRTAAGVDSELVCTAQHVNFFPEHNETTLGAEQTFRVNPRNLAVNRTEAIVQDSVHGAHFDRVTFTYKLWANRDITVSLLGVHNSWGRIGEPDVPRVAPPEGHTPPRGGTPPGRPPRRVEPEPTGLKKRRKRKA